MRPPGRSNFQSDYAGDYPLMGTFNFQLPLKIENQHDPSLKGVGWQVGLWSAVQGYLAYLSSGNIDEMYRVMWECGKLTREDLGKMCHSVAADMGTAGSPGEAVSTTWEKTSYRMFLRIFVPLGQAWSGWLVEFGWYVGNGSGFGNVGGLKWLYNIEIRTVAIFQWPCTVLRQNLHSLKATEQQTAIAQQWTKNCKRLQLLSFRSTMQGEHHTRWCPPRYKLVCKPT